MNRVEHLIDILGEECVEVSQRCSKALRFSLPEQEPGKNETNAERILTEFYEAQAMVDMLVEESILPVFSPERIRMIKESKKTRVEKYLLHSEKNGALGKT